MKKGNRRRSKLIIAAIAIVLLVGLIAFMKHKANSNEIILKTERVSLGTITTSVSGTGVLEPVTTVEVKSNVGGQIVYLGVDEGDQVKSGQVVARIDPSDSNSALEQSRADYSSAQAKVLQARQNLEMERAQYPAQLKSAEQAVTSAKARLAQAEAQARIQPKLTDESIKQEESALASAQASLRQIKTALIPQKLASAKSAYDQAKASEQQAKKDYERQLALLEKGFVAKSQVDSAEEKYTVAKAQLDTAKNKYDTIVDETDQDLLTAEAKVAQTKSALETAKANRVQDSIRQQELEAARASLKQAQASLDSIRATYRQQAVKSGDITQAEAQVKRAEAAVNKAATDLGYTTIVAPRVGVVVKKYVEEGSIVAAARSSSIGSGSGVALLEVADVSKMYALVDIDETDIAQIHIGQEVDVTVDAYPDDVFKGRVTKIAPQASTTTNVTTIPVKVELESTDLRLKPQMNATCDFITARKSNVLTVANAAVKQIPEGSTVMVIRDGKPVSRKVELGLADDDRTEVISGLKEGEIVVTSDMGPGMESSNGRGFSPGAGRQRRMGGPGGPPF